MKMSETAGRRGLAMRVAAVLAMVLMIAGCKSSTSTHKGVQGSGEEYGKSVETLAARLVQQADTPWTTLSVPVSVKVRDSGMPTVSGTMTMTRDKEIRLSLRLLGFEVGAACVTADSVFAYAKVQRMYVKESISDLMGGFPATTGNLQALLLGRLFTLGDVSPVLKGAETRLAEGGMAYSITPKAPRNNFAYTFTAGVESNSIESVKFVSAGRNADVVYDGRGVEITAVSGSRKLGASINMNMDKARWNGGADSRKFRIPDGYRRIKMSALLKALKEI